jgi:hypothetical protein
MVEDRSLLSALKDVATILLSLAAFVVSFLAFKYTVTQKPELRVLGGPYVSISYDANSEALALHLTAVVANYGRKMDVVKVAEGALSWDGSGAGPLRFGEVALSVPSGPIVAWPLAVKDNSAMELDVTATRLVEHESESFNAFFSPKALGMRNLSRKYTFEIFFHTVAEGDVALRRCFEFTNDVLSEIEKGGRRTVHVSNCGD